MLFHQYVDNISLMICGLTLIELLKVGDSLIQHIMKVLQSPPPYEGNPFQFYSHVGRRSDQEQDKTNFYSHVGRRSDKEQDKTKSR